MHIAYLSLMLAFGMAFAEIDLATVYINGKDVQVVDGRCDTTDGTAWATYIPAGGMNAGGWNELVITTNRAADPGDQAYGAGVLEGHFTSELMYNYWENYKDNEYGVGKGPSDALKTWMRQQQEYVRAQVENPQDEFWRAMQLLQEQFRGLVYGYNAIAEHNMTMSEIYMLNSVGDLEDLDAVFPASPPRVRHPRETDCSGLVRLLPAGDVACGQTTWRGFYAMLRVYKIYDFGYAKGYQPISFSSSPGLLHSKDDFYATSADLGVLETTNSIFNTSLYDLLSTRTVLSWQRASVANMLATSGEEWTNLFAQHNSGTYNNQWMVVDFKRSQPRRDGLLWIVEQIPGTTEAADVTNVLVKNGYWPSYNIPYFPRIFNASGYPAMVEQYGDKYSYDQNARALIFQRNVSSINEIQDVKDIMLYNNYEHDPLSLDDPSNAIACRLDLATAPRAFGGIDAKVTSASLWTELGACLAINGPTHTQLPPFSWAENPAFADVPRRGVPDVFDFDWTYIVARR